MKGGKAHSFSLSPQATRMSLSWAIETGADINGAGYLFAVPRKDRKAENFLSYAIRSIGLDKPEFADPASGETPTAHGFHTTFGNWAIHDGEWPNDLVEAQLAHSKGAVADAYLRDGQESPRRQMMDAWGAYVEADRRDGKYDDGFVYVG